MADTTQAAAARSPRQQPPRRAPQENLEDQVARLQDDIKAIGASLAKLSDQKVAEARSTAKSAVHEPRQVRPERRRRSRRPGRTPMRGS